MDELEEIKRKKILEMQLRQQEILQRQQEEERLQAHVEELEVLVKQFLTKEALQRYGNIRIAHPEKAVRVLAVLGRLIQTGKIRTQLTDTQFKEILISLEPKKTDFNIR